MQVFIYCKFTLHVSGVHRTHYQEYKKLTAAPGTGATTFLHRGLISPRWRKVVAPLGNMTCTRGCSYIFVLLMMGVMDARNM